MSQTYTPEQFRSDLGDLIKIVPLPLAMVLTACVGVAKDRWTEGDTKSYGTFVRDTIK
jgi:hypothetical protein